MYTGIYWLSLRLPKDETLPERNLIISAKIFRKTRHK